MKLFLEINVLHKNAKNTQSGHKVVNCNSNDVKV